MIRDEHAHIRNQMDERRRQVLAEHSQQIAELHKRHPQLADVDQEINVVKKQIIHLTVGKLRGKPLDGEIIRQEQELDRLRDKQRKLLRQLNIPATALEPKWDCPRCEDTGRLYVEDRYVNCDCIQARSRLFRRQAAGLPVRLQDAEFAKANFDLYPEGYKVKARKAFKYVRAYCDNLLSNGDGQGLFIHGETGTGKSYLLGCVANYLAEKMSVKYVVYADFLDQLRATFSSRDGEDSEQQLVAMVRNVDMLLLDDLGVERPTEFALKSLAQIIDYRYRNKLPLLVTSNFTLEELRERTKNDLYGERIVWRLIETCSALQLQGNIRLNL